MSFGNQKFDSFQQWVNYASSWLTSHPSYSDKPHNQFRATCFDSKGRLCQRGADMQLARDEDAFPVYWLWPDQIGPVALLALPLMKEAEKDANKEINQCQS